MISGENAIQIHAISVFDPAKEFSSGTTLEQVVTWPFVQVAVTDVVTWLIAQVTCAWLILGPRRVFCWFGWCTLGTKRCQSFIHNGFNLFSYLSSSGLNWCRLQLGWLHCGSQLCGKCIDQCVNCVILPQGFMCNNHCGQLTWYHLLVGVCSRNLHKLCTTVRVWCNGRCSWCCSGSHWFD